MWVVATAALLLALRWWPPPATAFMLLARLDAAREDDSRYVTRYEWVDYRRISPEAALAVIAAEDQQFPSHWGFDLRSIREAVEKSNAGGRLRGASTLSQQVAKNLFLWPGRSFVRKGLEAWFTVLIETLWPKRRILEVYLNVAELGRGVYGVEAASRKFFGKPAAGLGRAEAALLAAVLPNPSRLRVDRPSRYVLARRDWIMGQMRGLGGRSYLRQLDAGAAAPAPARASERS